MATLEERIQNLTQDINPPARRMTEQEVMEARQRDPMAARFGSANTGFYTDEPIGSGVMSDNEMVRINKALLSGVQDPMMANVDTSPMQPLVDLGFGDQVNVILSNPSDSQISRQAQQQIINEMGRGMDIDSFLMEVNNLAPKGSMSDADAGIMGLMSAGRNEDTTVGHLAEGDVVVPPEVLEANPSIIDELEDTMLNMGVDPRSRIVDTTGELGGIASINPETGLQEFFIKKALSKLNRARKKITKKLAPIVSVAAPFIPGVGPLAKAAITAASGKAAGLSTKDALLGGALSYGGSKLFGGTPATGAASKASQGNIFSRIGEYVMPGKDGISLLGNLGKSASGAYEYIMPGKDNVGLFGNVRSGISGLFGGGQQPYTDAEINSMLETMDPYAVEQAVNQRNLAISQGSQSPLGRIEDVAKMLTGDDGMTRTEELIVAGYTPEQIEQAKANGTFNALVSQARAEGKVPGRGAVGAIQSALTGGTQAGGDQGGLGMMGKLGIAGLAGLIGKLAYEEAKDQKGVPLTPLTQMDQLGRYNIEAEIARRTGAEMPSRVEFGLTSEGMPALSGGRPTVTEGMVYQPPEKRMMARGGIMAFADGGVVAMAEGGDMDVAINVEEFPVRDGQINGAGTETSDDIPAMLSDGEFVMTAKAVRGAGSFDVNNNNGILTLTPNGEPTRDSGTRVMYKLMEHFGNVA